MSPHDHVLGRLCTTAETRQKAEALYVRAAQLTRPGSGHALGAGQAALPAICAFLASQRLGNGEVAQDAARAATSLNEKTFKTALAAVERVLPASSPSSARATYAGLAARHGVRADDIVPMVEVDAALGRSGALAGATPDLVRCAVFHWVCTRVLGGAGVPEAAGLRREFKLRRAQWGAVHALLETHCAHMVEDLAHKAETAARARVTRSRSHARTAVFAPSAGSVKLYPETPSAKAAAQPKRKAAPEPGAESPSASKRRRDAPYAPSGLGRDLDTHTPRARRGNAAASARTIGLDGDEEEEVPSGTIVARTTRARSKGSHKAAWNAQRPTAKDRHLSIGSPPVTPSKNIAAIDSTPMTSTGTSDVSPRDPPSGVQTSRARSLKEFRAPAAKACAPFVEDEVPRHRRRNLRAPFLDRDAYGWNPSARTKQLLERARRWEALMIDKYGDPWDDL